MIPGTLLGALFLAACLVPGFVFLRVGEAKRALPARSSLIEAVELAGVGAAVSLLSVMAILIAERPLDFLDTLALVDDPGRYLLLHPLRGLGPLLASFALSCLLAYLAALVFFARRQSVFEPAGSTWTRTFYENLPNRKSSQVFVTLEMTDGRRIGGYLDSFTFEHDDNRELALRAPLAAAVSASDPLKEMGGAFLIIREKQIATITGLYVEPPDESHSGDRQLADETAESTA